MNYSKSNLIKEIENCKVNVSFSHPYRERYLRFASNLKNCMAKNEGTLEMFKYLMISERLNYFYAKTDGYRSIKVIGITSNQTQIYTTVHLGAYKLIAGHLLRNGINLCVPITNRVYNEQYNDYINLKKSSQSYTGNIDFVDIEEHTGIFKMIKYVKQGYSLLMYLDGNSGIGGMERADDKMISIDFFNKKILARKGIGFIANSLKLQIQPVVSFFDEHNYIPNIHYLYPIPYFEAKDKTVYGNELTQTLWNIFCKYIYRYPGQWEGWLYVDAFYEKEVKKKEPTQTSGLLRFNSDRYDFISKNGFFYLYDLDENVLVRTSEGLFNLFHKLHVERIHIDKNDFLTLIEKDSLMGDIIVKSVLTT